MAASRKLKINDTHESLSTTITDERLAKMKKENPNAGFKVLERDNVIDGQGCIVILNIPTL